MLSKKKKLKKPENYRFAIIRVKKVAESFNCTISLVKDNFF